MKRVIRFIGIDRAIAYTLLGRGWAILAGFMTLAMVARFLSPVDQGFYYTFSSVLALQVFFDLGLCYVVMQSASHEKAKLEWADSGRLEGDAAAKARLYSLFRFALGWYGAAALLITLVVLPAGLYFFSHHQQPAASPAFWRQAWMWLVCATALNMAISPAFALFQGCGLVAEVALVEFGQAVTGSLSLWLALARGWGLLAIPILNSASFIVGLCWLIVRKRAFVIEGFSHVSAHAGINWKADIWPFQWKIALSWLSGYFISQLFTPVLFAYQGPVIAGRMGMSISIATGLGTVALAWVTTKAPVFGVLVAKREYEELDRRFFTSLGQSLALIVVGGAVLMAGVFYLHAVGHPMSARILEPGPFGLLVATAIINHIVFSEAIYLRAHKQEPFLGPSILNGCLIGASTYFLGRYYGATAMAAGYLCVTLTTGLGLGSWIFASKRRLWHGEGALI